MNPTPPHTSNFGKWMALSAALLGWLFDGLEMGLFPLVQKPALDELVADPNERTLWIGVITSFFLIGAATGGVLFGWLGDRIGRVRSMMLSVLTYAIVSGLCGFATEAWHIGVLRFVAALGMGGEWSLGVALINEIWPDRSRAFLAGLIGAAANVGYLLIGFVGLGVIQQIGQVESLLVAVGIPEDWAKHVLRNEGWRFLMMLGAVPALLTFFIRWFVPESEKWERERGKGATAHWKTVDLLSVLIGALAACAIIALWAIPWQNALEPELRLRLFWGILGLRIVGTAVGFAIVTWGYLYPVMGYLRRVNLSGASTADLKPTIKRMLLAATLSGVALLGTWGTIQNAPFWAGKLVEDERKALPAESLPPLPPAKEWTQIATAGGAVLGTIAAALMGGWLGRRITYFLLCIASFAILLVFFLTTEVFDTRFLILGFAAGAISASFYGWLPLYLPELFPTAIRATGQGFGFNFGRIIAAIGVLQLQNLRAAFGGLPQACAALCFIYVVGVIVIWFVPETKGQPLPE